MRSAFDENCNDNDGRSHRHCRSPHDRAASERWRTVSLDQYLWRDCSVTMHVRVSVCMWSVLCLCVKPKMFAADLVDQHIQPTNKHGGHVFSWAEQTYREWVREWERTTFNSLNFISFDSLSLISYYHCIPFTFSCCCLCSSKRTSIRHTFAHTHTVVASKLTNWNFL